MVSTEITATTLPTISCVLVSVRFIDFMPLLNPSAPPFALLNSIGRAETTDFSVPNPVVISFHFTVASAPPKIVIAVPRSPNPSISHVTASRLPFAQLVSIVLEMNSVHVFCRIFALLSQLVSIMLTS